MDNASNPYQILLVDDLALFRRLLATRLGVLGVPITSVATVPEARTWLEEQRPALILLDVILPGVDGFTYCRELKADPLTRDIPVIMLTDLKANAYERSLEAGADDYLPKRVDDAIMRIRVKLHLHLADLRRRAGFRPLPEAPGQIALVSSSSVVHAQIPAQFAGTPHVFRILKEAEGLVEALKPSDTLLILDMAIGIQAVEDALTQVRMDPDLAHIPILLLMEKEEAGLLAGIEFMVDDVIWKPLKAQVNRARFAHLLEMGLRARQA
nr:response regulator [uncultured Holophaga sp.]